MKRKERFLDKFIKLKTHINGTISILWDTNIMIEYLPRYDMIGSHLMTFDIYKIPIEPRIPLIYT